MRKCFVILGLVLMMGVSVWGQTDVQHGGAVSFEPTGPGVLFGALDPAVKKWYVPQELFMDYGWRQWEYSNYARTPYERYVNTTREGDYFYDVYGNFTTRGWLIYDWRQFQPQPLGSGIFQSTRFNRWFNAVTHQRRFAGSVQLRNHGWRPDSHDPDADDVFQAGLQWGAGGLCLGQVSGDDSRLAH